MEVIDFISNKFDEYEKDKKEKEEIIKTLMSKRVKNKNEKTDGLCITMINEHLELSITEAHIEHTHRIEKSGDAGHK